ncbi:uncharacterized protein N7511_003185 [Penicillium nucicola]|uniref:uncharacterized protein n=1 Tax=Penicillium nucicola TaxID=1850975 RepID=UPI002544E3CC|nr:uncharacterized protein N7511_003185 [Penicillium nucicola]KAJ5771134.1 hypothetical protein N7511_003185 [Penicillium nucicola]
MAEITDVETIGTRQWTKEITLDAPGTAYLEDPEGAGSSHRGIILQPTPTSDPNDPLNWSFYRKCIHFAIASFFTMLVFALIDIGPVIWQDFEDLLHISYPQLNNQYAVNCVCLGLGSIILVPLALKFGRRPIYLLTAIIALITAIWQAVLRDLANMMAAQAFNGLACAVGWTLVPITITDLFFVHQRGRANAVYQLMSSTGVFLAPVAAGYIANAQGWPWIFWWSAIFLGVNLLLFVFLLEETKFSIHTIAGSEASVPASSQNIGNVSTGDTSKWTHPVDPESHIAATTNSHFGLNETGTGIDHSIPLKTARQRLALFTTSTGPTGHFIKQIYTPVQVLVTIPAVSYVMIQYSSALVWFTVVATTQSEYLALPPYNFGTTGIGLLNVPPFIGSVLGCIWGGPVSDWSIKFLARRNEGIYEPEMRLYISFLPAIVGPVGLFLYGYSVSEGLPWIFPCLGSGFYGFSMAALIPIALTYLTDSYNKILGTALIGVSFAQYMVATIIIFALDPWINGMGLYNTFTVIGCLAIGCNLLCIPMILFGKKWRISCKERDQEQWSPRSTRSSPTDKGLASPQALRGARGTCFPHILAISSSGMDPQAIAQSQSSDVPRKRKRTACRTCRDRRVKCDNGRPSCQSCCTLKLACVYPDDSASTNAKFDSGSLEILHQLQGIRTVLDRVAQTQDSNASATNSLTPRSSTESNWRSATRKDYSLEIEHRGNLTDRTGYAPSNRPRIGVEGLLFWPKIKEFLGEPVVKRSFLIECNVDTDASVPDGQTSKYGIREDDFLTLCRKFLDYVHVRNPILEPSQLEQYAKELTESGLKWDTKTCLVLLACALGCFGSESSYEEIDELGESPTKDDASYARAEAYYEAARKRIGYLGTSLLDIQCLYLAGMYEKHTLRILQAWFFTEQACSRLHAYLLCQRGPTEPSEQSDHRLEQRLYWSCIKAESEFLNEIPLIRSALISLDYPDPFPSPPKLPSDENLNIDSRDISFNKRQEQSWLYYLAEIALRRTLDQEMPLINSPEAQTAWIENINYILQQSEEIDEQLNTWYNHLPSTIRPPVDPKLSPSDQLSFFLQARFLGGREKILRPFFYYVLHNDGGAVSQAVLSRANEYVHLARGLIIHLRKNRRHGGIWYALRGIWGLAMIILTIVHVQIDGLPPPFDWMELVSISLKMLRNWSVEAADIRQIALLSSFIGSFGLVAKSAALKIDEKDFTSTKALHDLVHRVASVGLRLPGSDVHNELVDWVNTSLHDIPGLEVEESKYDLDVWEPKEGISLSESGSLCIESGGICLNVPIVGAIPFTLPTNGSALTGPLIYIPSNQSISSVDVRGKIILRDFIPLPVPYSYLLKDSHYITPDLATRINTTYERPYLSTPADDLIAAGQGGANGLISAFDIPRKTLEGYYDPHFGQHYLVPGVYLGSDQYYMLRNASQCGHTAFIKISANTGRKYTRELFATLPGRSNETIIIGSHTDGATWVQENGVAGLLALAKYFAAQPTTSSARAKTLKFAFTSGHLTYSKDGAIPYAKKLDQEYDDGNLALVIVLEHMGARELLPSSAPKGQYGRVLNFTGNSEATLWSVGPTQPVLDAVTAVVKGRMLDGVGVTPGNPPKNASQIPFYASQGGIGTTYHNYLLPTTSIVSGPWSLWAPSFGEAAIDFSRLRDQLLAVVDLVIDLGSASKAEIAGGYIEYREMRANGFPWKEPSWNSQYLPGPQR